MMFPSGRIMVLTEMRWRGVEYVRTYCAFSLGYGRSSGATSKKVQMGNWLRDIVACVRTTGPTRSTRLPPAAARSLYPLHRRVGKQPCRSSLCASQTGQTVDADKTQPLVRIAILDGADSKAPRVY